METAFVVIVGAFVASAFMITALSTFIWQGFHHGDMINVYGGLITKEPRFKTPLGLIVYFLTGLILSPIYFLVLDFLDFQSFGDIVGFAAIMGVAVGFILMLFLIEDRSDEQPGSLHDVFWVPIAFVHWFGHLLFGFALGVLFAAYQIFALRGFSLAVMIILLASLVISYFSKRGAHLEALEERQREELAKQKRQDDTKVAS